MGVVVRLRQERREALENDNSWHVSIQVARYSFMVHLNHAFALARLNADQMILKLVLPENRTQPKHKDSAQPTFGHDNPEMALFTNGCLSCAASCHTWYANYFLFLLLPFKGKLGSFEKILALKCFLALCCDSNALLVQHHCKNSTILKFSFWMSSGAPPTCLLCMHGDRYAFENDEEVVRRGRIFLAAVSYSGSLRPFVIDLFRRSSWTI